MANGLDCVTVSGATNNTSSETDTRDSALDEMTIFRICVLVIITVLSLFGNGLTIAAIAKFPSLQTPSNYVILSLAVSDFLQPLGVGLSLAMGIFAPSVCSKYFDVTIVVVANITVVSSLLHLLVIAAERFVAVIRPLRYHSVITVKAVRKTLFATWMFSIAFALSSFVSAFINNENSCGSDGKTKTVGAIYDWALGVTVYLLLTMSLIILYAQIAVVARKHRRRIQSVTQIGTVPQETKTQKSPNLMTYILVIYVVTWTPMFVVTCLGYYGPFDGIGLQIGSIICQQLAIGNCCVNVFLYAWRSKPLRSAYKKLLSNLCSPA